LIVHLNSKKISLTIIDYHVRRIQQIILSDGHRFWNIKALLISRLSRLTSAQRFNKKIIVECVGLLSKPLLSLK